MRKIDKKWGGKMTLTKQFQDEVATKVTRLLEIYIDEIKGTDQWQQLSDQYANHQVVSQRYHDIYDFIQFNGFYLDREADASRLFICERLVNIETESIRQRGHYRRIPAYNLLECVSEASSRYFENDGVDIGNNHTDGRSIYSPVVDLAIVPTVRCRRSITQPLGRYPLFNGNLIFGELSKLSFMVRFQTEFKRIANNNLRAIGLNYNDDIEHNHRPLYLFAIEIENQINKKHLMGDFINSLMLSRFPVVVVPETKLDDCLEIIKLSKIISDIKDVHVFEILSRVMVLSITQFRQIINRMLETKGLLPLAVEEFR
ncbi:hypothetical protein [Pectinatus frisingensis]|uniref:hypothetical protein n=1 Tax=Pectinatus frisingensis TaxID=865 RepID=UPI0018C68BD5|nr:hypothetical protein [Pectinatus frisingensis]